MAAQVVSVVTGEVIIALMFFCFLKIRISSNFNSMSTKVNRTWRFEDGAGKSHEVSLYHHTITGFILNQMYSCRWFQNLSAQKLGARGAMFDYSEIPSSVGMTTILHSQHAIWFVIAIILYVGL